ncbi:MAG: GGDEF domain-containing protein [bacterium]
MKQNMPHGKLFKKVILYEYIGFAIVILFLWLDEILDIPHHLFSSEITPINYTESIFETGIVFLLACFIILATRKLIYKIEHIAICDPLTNLPNRRFLMEYLEYEKKRSSRSKREFSIIFGDLDHFKKINDTYGHECGDRLLQKVAVVLKSTLRHQDVVSRWGGEEFVILLPDTSLENARYVAEKLRKNVADQPFFYRFREIKKTMSFGVSNHSYENIGSDTGIQKADYNMYQAKQKGRNTVVA